MSGSGMLLEARGVTMRFGGVTAVQSVDLSLREVELRCLIGPNGAGKSTFFKMLTGQLVPSEGIIRFRGKDITGANTHEIARLGVGIKTQVPNVFNGLSVQENVFIGAARRKSMQRARQIVDDTLSRLQLDSIADRMVGQLAHGQRQWVEIATVLAQEPTLILLDEPAAGMNHAEVQRTAELIRGDQPHSGARGGGARHAVHPHDRQHRDGVQPGTRTHGGQCRARTCGSTCARRLPGETGGMTTLAVSRLRSGYGRIPILAGVNLSVADGEIVGILGHNGMGKTTLLRTLMGYLPATDGSVRFDNREITRLSPTARARLGMGYVPQGREIFASLTVADNLRMGCLRSPNSDQKIAAILEDFPRLTRLLDRAGGALSGGEQQLLALARCLCADPRLILLDEPTEGIQPSIIEEMIETLLGVRRRRPVTVVLVEQNLNFISSLADRILILQKGEVTREIPPEIARDRTMIDEFVGMA